MVVTFSPNDHYDYDDSNGKFLDNLFILIWQQNLSPSTIRLMMKPKLCIAPLHTGNKFVASKTSSRQLNLRHWAKSWFVFFTISFFLSLLSQFFFEWLRWSKMSENLHQGLPTHPLHLMQQALSLDLLQNFTVMWPNKCMCKICQHL